MVDINLIGDDQPGEEKTSEEDRVEQFTQTSSMDTQELAFEERTETFDTTKTGGFPHRRSYSSFASVLIIVSVIIILFFAVYWFMFRGDDTGELTEMPQFIPESESVVETIPSDTEQQIFETESQSQSNIDANIPETQAEPEDLSTNINTPPISQPSTSNRMPLDAASSQYLSNTLTAIQTVNDVLSTVPPNLSATLLSYTGKRLRMELVGASKSATKSFAATLNQSFGGNIEIQSESQVASNGGSLERVLLSGSIASNPGNLSGGVESFDVDQLKSWIQVNGKQFGLQVRPIKVLRSTSANGMTRIPVQVRLLGKKNSILGFLEAISSQRLNVDIAKILLVSPDMVTYRDDELALVLYMFLSQAL